MIHSTPIAVRFYELDPYRHLNHSVYIQYFEVGRIDLFAEFGWTLTGMSDLGVHIVVIEIDTRFLAAGVEGDELVVETWVEEVKRVTMSFGQRIVRGETDLWQPNGLLQRAPPSKGGQPGFPMTFSQGFGVTRPNECLSGPDRVGRVPGVVSG